MLTLEQALRRSAAITFGLVALAGTAVADDEPTTGSDGDGTAPSADGEGTAPTTQTEPEPTAPEPTDTTQTNQPSTTVVVEDEGTTATPPPPQPTYTSQPPPPMEETSENTLERWGVGVALGGGVEGFTRNTARDATNDGGGWDVRVMVGTRSPIAFEGAYIGSAQSIDALGLDNDAVLVGNGVEGKARVNFLDRNIQPFAFGGVGWRHYNIANENFNTSAINDQDDVLEIPVGLGLAWKYQGFLIDARGEYRFAAGEDLMPSNFNIGANNNNSAGLDRYSVNANVGYAF